MEFIVTVCRDQTKPQKLMVSILTFACVTFYAFGCRAQRGKEDGEGGNYMQQKSSATVELETL